MKSLNKRQIEQRVFILITFDNHALWKAIMRSLVERACLQNAIHSFLEGTPD